MSEKTTQATGIGFCGILAIVFIVLKLMKVIAWSWLWVLAPLWLPTVLWLLVMFICILLSLKK